MLRLGSKQWWWFDSGAQSCQHWRKFYSWCVVPAQGNVYKDPVHILIIHYFVQTHVWTRTVKTFQVKIMMNGMNPSLVMRRIRTLIIEFKIVFLNKNYMSLDFSWNLLPWEICINFIFASLVTFNELLIVSQLGLNAIDQW